MSIYTNSFTIRNGTLPLGFNGTWQDFLDQLPNLLDVTVADGFATFVVGSITPTSNQGPWFKDGTTLYVWDTSLAAYRPVSLESASKGYLIGPTAPTITDNFLWFRTNAQGSPLTLNKFHDGQWRSFGYSRGDVDQIVPIGLTCMWQGSVAQLENQTPAWKLSDGGTYNGFTTQDLRNRFIVGSGDDYTTGQTGGVDQNILDAGQLPEHRHQVGTLSGATSEAGLHRHEVEAAGGSDGVFVANAGTGPTRNGQNIGAGGVIANQPVVQTQQNGNHTHDVTISGQTGTGVGLANDPLENRPRFYSLAYITYVGLP
jgi:microcystin-dependent protein